MVLLPESIAEVVWESKYRYQRQGVFLDKTVEETWQRVAKAVAHAESKTARAHWQKQFYGILDNFHFLPGGRILAGAGTQHHVTLFNCYVMDIPDDSLAAIFTALKEGALTLQQGGGVGYDFSILRPHGELVKKTGLPASGPVSFMRVWDTMCAVLLSTGARRGAMMGVLRCDHPDIEEFITAKADRQELRNFNVSVLVTDAFMQAVKNDAEWPLVFPLGHIYKRVRARALWEKIIRAAYDYAEPGVLFGDTINRLNNLWYREQIGATNPCGEIPLPAYGACNLGSINLTQLVLQPFTPMAKFNWQRLEEIAMTATRFLDNVINISRYPLARQREQAFGTRRIGLGITGLADMLVMLGLKYGSPEALAFSKQIMQKIAHVTWQTSIALAEEKGSFPFYDAEKYLQGAFVSQLPAEIRQDMAAHGMRNSHHNTIAPTGSISLFAHNVSGGIEPIFQAQYTRQIRTPEGSKTYTIQDYAYHLWQQQKPDTPLPPAWVEVNMLTPSQHLAMQAAIQPYVDNAISKTINLPADFPFSALSDVYTEAYNLGLKGCTIFRPNPVTGSILSSSESDEKDRCCQLGS